MKPTRWYSSRQEKHIAKTIGGRQVANSGAGTWSKGDIRSELFLIEAKTCTSEKKSFSIKKEWLEKNKEEAFAMRKCYSALVFNFGPDTDNYYIIDEKLFRHINELLEQEENDA